VLPCDPLKKNTEENFAFVDRLRV